MSQDNLLFIFPPFEQPYIELANSYGTGKIAELEAYVNANTDKFESVGSFSYFLFFEASGILTIIVPGSALCLTSCFSVLWLLINLSPKLSAYVTDIFCENLLFQDNNLGLVKQVVSSMYKRNIQRLTQTYLTLSLQDIANTVQLNSPKEAEMHVLQMVVLRILYFYHIHVALTFYA